MAVPMFSVDSFDLDKLDAPESPRLHRHAAMSPPAHGWIHAFAQSWTAVASPRIADLVAAGIPPSIVTELRALVAAGAEESVVVAAFIGAIVAWLDDQPNAPPLSRHAYRVLRRAHAGAAGHEALRANLRQRVDSWCAMVAAAEDQLDAF
jgi:hypothetical protein